MKYRLTGNTPRTLANGNTLAPGDKVTLTSEDCEPHDTAWLIEEGLLVEVPSASKPRRRSGKANEAKAEAPGEDTNGGSDR